MPPAPTNNAAIEIRIPVGKPVEARTLTLGLTEVETELLRADTVMLELVAAGVVTVVDVDVVGVVSVVCVVLGVDEVGVLEVLEVLVVLEVPLTVVLGVLEVRVGLDGPLEVVPDVDVP